MKDVPEEQWKVVQTKTFTKWMNSKLSKVPYPPIDNLVADVGTGVPLVHLLQVLGVPIPRHNQQPRSRIAKMENVTFVLDAIKGRGIPLVNIGSSDIVDSDSKLILGLIWTIISRLSISEAISSEYLSLREELLQWVRKVTSPYENVDVKNFTSSWKDGLAFNAIIHRFHPNLIDYASLDDVNGLSNCAQAFTVAENKLEIARLLDPEDVAEAVLPDEKSIITYVSQFYQKFKSLEEELENKTVLRGFLAGLAKSTKMRHDYEQRAQKMLAAKKDLQSGMALLNTLYYDLCVMAAKCEEKNSQLIGEYVDMTELLASVREHDRLLSLREYSPPAGLGLEALDLGYERVEIDKSVMDKALDAFSNREASQIVDLKGQCAEFHGIADNKAQSARLLPLQSRLDTLTLSGRSKLDTVAGLRSSLKRRGDALEELMREEGKATRMLDAAAKMFRMVDPQKTGTITPSDCKKILKGLKLAADEPGQSAGPVSLEQLLETVRTAVSLVATPAKLKRVFATMNNGGAVQLEHFCSDVDVRALPFDSKVSYDLIREYLNQ